MNFDGISTSRDQKTESKVPKNSGVSYHYKIVWSRRSKPEDITQTSNMKTCDLQELSAEENEQDINILRGNKSETADKLL